MSAERAGCCADWPKPCTYHEGYQDALDALLTPTEFEAMDLLGKAANAVRRVIGDGDQAEHDWSEAADKIHQLQTTVMAQAASRAYPEKYRPLGGWPKSIELKEGSNCPSI